MIAWFASTAYFAWSRHLDWNAVRAPVIVYALTLAVVLLGGSLRIWLASGSPRVIRAATINRPVDLFVPGEMTRIASGRLSPDEQQAFAPKLERLHAWFLDASRREARAGAALVAWPEQNLLVFAENEPEFLDRARRLAAGEHVYLAMGLGTVHVGAPRPLENKLVVIDSSGRMVSSYRKTHPVQGWEASVMQVGDGRLPVIDTAIGRVGTAICFDADFPEFIRQAGRNAADLLVVAANDWVQIKRAHAEMAAFRAVETGAAVIRPAASGLSTAVDPWGRLLGVSDYFASGDRTLTVQVPVGGVRTIYSRTGDVFAWLCVMAAVVLFGVVAVRSVA
jgi:apolipoprotein N-acyltransferase